MHPAIGFKLV